MANTNACMNSLTSKGLSQQEAQQVIDMVENTVNKTRGTAYNPTQAAANRLAEAAREKRRVAQIKKRQAILNMVKRDRIKTFLGQAQAEGATVLDGINALLVGSGKRFTGSRDSVSRTAASLKAIWSGSLAKEIDRLGVAKLLNKDRKFADQVMSEMIEPGKSGNQLARDTADVFSRYLEEWRLRSNEVGADIGKLDHYAPQSHDSLKLRRVSEKEWIDFITPRLDMEKTFPNADPKDVANILSEVYNEITTGIRPSHDTATSRAPIAEGFSAPSNMANRMNKERSLHFKDAQSAIEYQQKFSNGTIMDAMMRRLESTAKKVAMMDTFGPNPEYMIKSILDEQKQLAKTNPELADRLNQAWTTGRTGWLANRYKVLAGEVGTPENPTVARISGVMRSVTSMAKLGGAVLSSFSDIVIKAAAARHMGESWLGQWKHGFEMRFEGLQSAEKVELGRSLGVFVNGMLGELYNRFDMTDAIGGTTTRMMNTFFKLSGLEGWTEAHRAAYAYYLSNRLARFADMAWGDLDADYRAVLEKNGMEKYWDVMRHMVQDVEGERYVVPERARQLDEANIAHLLPVEYQAMPAGVDPVKWDQGRQIALNSIRNEIETKAMGYIADELSYAVLEPDAKVRASMYQGSRPGSVKGEAMRFMLQFKAFPVTYFQRYMNEARWQRASVQPVGGFSGVMDPKRITSDIPGFIHFFLASTVLGYMSMIAKDLTKGRSPRDITANPEEVTIAAVLQGGGLGLLGDFLLGESDRFGNQVTAQAAGPTITSLLNSGTAFTGQAARGEFRKMGETALRFGIENTPFVNLWYTRMAVDYLIQYHLREMMNPGTLAKSERKMKKQFNQTYLQIGSLDLTPSHVIKRGGGFK